RRRSTSATPRRSRWRTGPLSTSTGPRRSRISTARPSRSWPSTTWPRPARRSLCPPRSGIERGASPCSPPAARDRGRPAPLCLGSGWPASWRWPASSPTSMRRAGTPTTAIIPGRFGPPPSAPGVNPHKRYQSGSFAPTRIAAGWDNRTCGFRLCGEGGGFRVENRIPGADANPYLAFAATIAAGLHGIANGLKAPKPYEGNAYEDATLPQVPKTLREAIAELERSKVARTAFGERVIEHYLHTARLEQGAFDQVVTDWELARNFERI